MNAIPDELLAHIMEYLSPRFCMLSVALVSKRLYEIAQSTPVWKEYILNLFPYVNITDDYCKSTFSRLCARNKAWYNPPEMICLPHKHTDAISIVELSDCGSWMYTCSWDNIACLWRQSSIDKDRFSPYSDFCDEEAIVALRWNHTKDHFVYPEHQEATLDKHIAVISGWGTDIKVITSNEEPLVLSEHEDSVKCLSRLLFDQGTFKVLSGSTDTDIKLWDIYAETSISTFQSHSKEVTKIQYIDRDMFASTSRDHRCLIWDSRSPSYCMEHTSPSGIYKLEVDREKNLIYATSYNGHVIIWELRKGVPVEHKIHDSRITCMTLLYAEDKKFGKDTPVIVTGAKDLSVCVTHGITGELLHKYDTHSGIINCVDGDQSRVISGSYDQTVRIWTQNPKCEDEDDRWLNENTQQSHVLLDDASSIANVEVLTGPLDIVSAISYNENQIMVGCGNGALYKWKFSS
jgi:WD40 repeat protein